MESNSTNHPPKSGTPFAVTSWILFFLGFLSGAINGYLFLGTSNDPMNAGYGYAIIFSGYPRPSSRCYSP